MLVVRGSGLGSIFGGAGLPRTRTDGGGFVFRRASTVRDTLSVGSCALPPAWPVSVGRLAGTGDVTVAPSMARATGRGAVRSGGDEALTEPPGVPGGSAASGESKVVIGEDRDETAIGAPFSSVPGGPAPAGPGSGDSSRRRCTGLKTVGMSCRFGNGISSADSTTERWTASPADVRMPCRFGDDTSSADSTTER
ncbi:hypothetical protein DMC63_05750 [Streptomyces sp. WAC 05977]|nr:hypothetical protein DMC63_05750 [Streptomyces sp. WAC 05977]